MSRASHVAGKGFIALLVAGCLGYPAMLPARSGPAAQDLRAAVLQRESTGDLAGARSLLESQAGGTPDSGAAEVLAEFLDRHHDPGRRDAYVKWASAEKDPEKRKLALREVALLDVIDSHNGDLAADLARYHAAGGTDLNDAGRQQNVAVFSTIQIPGPLSSFARMAALAPDLAPEELLGALARNVATNGYQAAANETLEPTEYLRLILRYVNQARELENMAGSARKIVIPSCDSEQTGALLKILGYRMRGSCGGDIVLETVNATRAFLTVDSAFPLTELEQDLRANRHFELPYAPTSVPVLYNAGYWLSAAGRPANSDFLDAFLADPSLCRLYLGLVHLDRQTAEAIKNAAPPDKLRLYAHVLDFFGGMFEIRNGAAVVPGSPRMWASLLGVSPSNPGAFFTKLIATDDGWMASYFDALSRINGPTAAYLTQPDRMRRFYEAVRGKITTPGPARPVFRSSTELMLLTTSLRIDPNGQPHIPGNLEVWQHLFIHHPNGKYDGKLTRSAANWRNGDDLVEALFALSRKAADNEPLKIFLLLNDVDRGRTKPISPEIASRLVSAYKTYRAQYLYFADAPALSERSMNAFLDVCASLTGGRDNMVKADATGTMQSLVELWRILSAQNSIPAEAQDAAFLHVVTPFLHVKQESEVFQAARGGVDTLLTAANVSKGEPRQEALMELLVGKVHSESGAPPCPAEVFLRVFDAQRLISLDALFSVAANGAADSKAVKSIDEQLSRLEESESLRGTLSPDERNSLVVGYWGERHVEQERKLNVDKLLKSNDHKAIEDALAPLVRDSLVGILYSYYAPAGAQLLYANPVFVRSHDFLGPENTPVQWRETEVAGTGWPASGGGRLMGSLVALPYALADAEQNFLMPKREQALIWADLVPQMIANVTVNRWRQIKPEQLRWVSLHLDRSETLLAAAKLDASVREAVMDSYRRYESPTRAQWLDEQIRAGRIEHAVASIPAAVLYAVACDPALEHMSPDVASEEIAAMKATNDPDLTPQAIALAFGTPKPTLTHSYRPGLLYLRTFPALMGYSSRILAESWESNNLYYAALADKVGVPANELDAYVPEWNRSAIEYIFATHLEDWPALLRSLQTVANNVKHRDTDTGAAHGSEN